MTREKFYKIWQGSLLNIKCRYILALLLFKSSIAESPTNDALTSLGPTALSNLTNPANVNQLADMLKTRSFQGNLMRTA
jgi:hypothetical protein